MLKKLKDKGIANWKRKAMERKNWKRKTPRNYPVPKCLCKQEKTTKNITEEEKVPNKFQEDTAKTRNDLGIILDFDISELFNENSI